MKLPLDDKYFRWTTHVKEKLLFYRLSPQIVKTVLKNPVRRETGIAPNTIAVMKRNDTVKRKEEVWVMYRTAERGPAPPVIPAPDRSRGQAPAGIQSPRKQKKSKKSDGLEIALALRKLLVPEKKIIISAWRYPGTTKPGDPVPIPEDIEMELGVEYS